MDCFQDRLFAGSEAEAWLLQEKQMLMAKNDRSELNEHLYTDFYLHSTNSGL